MGRRHIGDIRLIEFVLPFATPSLNVRDRQHWAVRNRAKWSLSRSVMVAIGGPRYLPIVPLQRARVTVTRYGRTMDLDNLYASVKGLGDILCVASKTHPAGLGFIVDDAPSCLELIVRQEHARPRDAKTVVRIEPIPEL
jgi:hypothetical protein